MHCLFKKNKKLEYQFKKFNIVITAENKQLNRKNIAEQIKLLIREKKNLSKLQL